MYEKYSVIFVDDEINILNAIRREMFEENFKMFFANSGKEALEIIDNNDISVIVSDMRMPEMNGLELLKIVEEKSSMIVKMVLTGYTQIPQILATVNQVDIQKFIPKPWIAEEFIVMIHKALDLYIIKEENLNYKKTLEAQNKSYKNILTKINNLIENTKISSEFISLVGKKLIAFGENFSNEQNELYKEILDTRTKIFDVLGSGITNEKKRISTQVTIDSINNEMSNEFIKYTIKQCSDNVIINIDIMFFEAILKILITIFNKEFKDKGVYVNVDCNEDFNVTIICPNVDVPTENIKSVSEMKIAYFCDIFNGKLNSFGIDCNLIKSNNNIVALLKIKKEDNK